MVEKKHGGKRPGSGRKETTFYRRVAFAVEFLRAYGVPRKKAERVVVSAMVAYDFPWEERKKIHEVLFHDIHKEAREIEAALKKEDNTGGSIWHRPGNKRIKTPKDENTKNENVQSPYEAIADREEREKVFSWLAQGMSPQDIINKKGVERETVAALYKEWSQDLNNDDADKMLDKANKMLKKMEEKRRLVLMRIRHHTRSQYSWGRWQRKWEEAARKGPITYGPSLVFYVNAAEPLFTQEEKGFNNPNRRCIVCGKEGKYLWELSPDEFETVPLLTMAHWQHPLFLARINLGTVCCNLRGDLTDCEHKCYRQSEEPFWGVSDWYPLRGVHGNYLYMATYREIVLLKQPGDLPTTWEEGKPLWFPEGDIVLHLLFG